MQRDSFINTRDFARSFREQTLVSGLAERLGEISATTLVVVGQLDMDFIHCEAQMLADRIRGAQLEVLQDTEHRASSGQRPSIASSSRSSQDRQASTARDDEPAGARRSVGWLTLPALLLSAHDEHLNAEDGRLA
jgi:hypothetical protein